ncbi:hypothetical protein JKG68_13795 [Microvirga aerilata]|uniref:Uncharacterized protein n=1 Tax=Microvirga aerilata TaxID=670292 RepID=A0A937D2B1_9HYPH|nr:hypothetical protein [Microvirga aerilata]MBL0405045.1 hypothetical protein [Microvirga aerilata]
MISRAIKNLTPLSLRIFLKNRLPARIVGAVATPPASTRDKADNGRRPIQPQCPICGTSLPSAPSQLDIQCTGCGALPHHRKLALAVYAHARLADTQVLVVGSDDVLQLICEGLEKVTFAPDPADVPVDLRSKVDLCIHSYWLQGSKMGPEKSLRSLDALLSPKGKQIFTLDTSCRWHPIQWQRGPHAFLEWLHRGGWAEANVFEPDEVYGGGAGEAFGCSPTIESPATAVILPGSMLRS